MSDESPKNGDLITVQSTRFGEFSVAKETLIHFPSGIIGFPERKEFVMLEHKAPFCWLHSTEDENLAFVVVDGLEFGENYKLDPPIGDSDTDLQTEDEYAILVIVTVRPDAKMTSANLKAPLFINLRNRRGTQIIFDDPRLSTRFLLWGEQLTPASEYKGKKKAKGEGDK